MADIIALVQALKNRGKIAIAANGRLTVAALFAAALTRDIESVYLSGGLCSFRDIAESENYKQPLANMIPNVLAHADLPQLAGALAPRRVHLASATGADGKPKLLDALRKIYPHSNVELSKEAGWNVERFLQL